MWFDPYPPLSYTPKLRPRRWSGAACYTYHVVGGVQSRVLTVRVVSPFGFGVQVRFRRVHVRQVDFAAVLVQLRATVLGLHPVRFAFRESLETVVVVVVAAFVMVRVVVERRTTPPPQLPVALVKLRKHKNDITTILSKRTIFLTYQLSYISP